MLQLHELTNAQHSITAHQGGTWTIDAITNAVTVTATNLDVRDLTSASDSVEIKTAAGQALAIDGSGYITANINGTVVVSATDLDIRNLAYAIDSVTAYQGGTWTIDAITNAVTVVATNLDIRDLSSSTDSISTVQQAFQTWKTSAVPVTNSATQIAASPLTGRKKIIIQNVGSNDIFVKDANTVSAAVDGKIAKGASFEMELGASATIYGITASGSADVRVWEFAA